MVHFKLIKISPIRKLQVKSSLETILIPIKINQTHSIKFHFKLTSLLKLKKIKNKLLINNFHFKQRINLIMLLICLVIMFSNNLKILKKQNRVKNLSQQLIFKISPFKINNPFKKLALMILLIYFLILKNRKIMFSHLKIITFKRILTQRQKIKMIYFKTFLSFNNNKIKEPYHPIRKIKTKTKNKIF